MSCSPEMARGRACGENQGLPVCTRDPGGVAGYIRDPTIVCLPSKAKAEARDTMGAGRTTISAVTLSLCPRHMDVKGQKVFSVTPFGGHQERRPL